ncbi:MAG: GNAT family N-acetyltransferase [Nostoc sp. NMS1]|uniref:GNAT family N-acetyltransferase n=1 Tax=unclassified Nostoc TaxID=2593658 RepID=UPI0025E87F1D|nr:MULTISPECIES: GNAT family N-acetyltransferase [unclassified Nostoc]MBN3905108.1 GNAT family N-acetyltransferase [Nostoc sp. NMS1]MBN3990294.1 GNAT family N-acetyltransferase [Nostoc sp. NMS2]
MEIVTKRFLLRDFIKEDEPSFFAYRADPRYAEFCTPEEVAPSYTRELLCLFGQWADEHPRLNYQLAIVDRRSLQELIGCCGLRRDSHGSDRAELGIELAPQFWGRYAYAIEVAKALIEFGFRDLALKEIRGISVSANLRVTRLAHRYGFVAIGTLPSPDWMCERGWSQTEWQLTQESWESVAALR